MSNDQFLPERDFCRRQKRSLPAISERAWVKHDFEFWHRCTIEDCLDIGVDVSLDNMEELTVRHEDVRQLDLEEGDLVFVQHWIGSLSGKPGFVVATRGESVKVEFPESLYGGHESDTFLLRDLRLYLDVPLTAWPRGTRVFAYKAVQFKPPLFLLFPAIVKDVHYEVCVEVEFEDGTWALVPITLVEPCKFSTGDTVHTCTSYLTTAGSPDERWGPCRVVRRVGDNLILEDGKGAPFEANIAHIAKLPKGYQMPDGKLERIMDDAPGAFQAMDEPAKLPPSTVVYIVRTDHWLEAADKPVTRADIDRLMAGDPELTWLTDAGASSDSSAQGILWNGVPCFWWNRHSIVCTGPNERQLAKLIEIAIEMDANVIGEQGQEYH